MRARQLRSCSPAVARADVQGRATATAPVIVCVLNKWQREAGLRLAAHECACEHCADEMSVAADGELERLVAADGNVARRLRAPTCVEPNISRRPKLASETMTSDDKMNPTPNSFQRAPASANGSWASSGALRPLPLARRPPSAGPKGSRVGAKGKQRAGLAINCGRRAAATRSARAQRSAQRQTKRRRVLLVARGRKSIGALPQVRVRMRGRRRLKSNCAERLKRDALAVPEGSELWSAAEERRTIIGMSPSFSTFTSALSSTRVPATMGQGANKRPHAQQLPHPLFSFFHFERRKINSNATPEVANSLRWRSTLLLPFGDFEYGMEVQKFAPPSVTGAPCASE